MPHTITVHRYTPEFRDEWEKFVRSSNNGTMFQKQAFLDYHDEGKFLFHHLMFRENGRLVGVLPGGFFTNDEGAYWSPIGASYGSIVTQDEPFERCLAIVDALMDYCRKENFREIFLIPPPLIYSKNYSQHVEYAMLYRKFDFELHYISHAVHLNKGADPQNYLGRTARLNVKKALRDGHIEIAESERYDHFYPILLENKAKHGSRPTHSLEDLLRLRELLPDNLRLILVYYKGEPIAGSLLFLTNSKVALCFYNMMRYEYKHLRPVYLMMSEIIRWALESGYEWLDIGVSQDTSSDDPMTPSLSLIDFKEQFGARGILRSTYHYKFRD